MEYDVFKYSIIFVLAAGILYGVFTLMKTRSEEILAKWAHDNGYQILDSQPKVFNRGPFAWSSKNQTVFRVAVQDTQGNQRTGWVRCGSYMGGIISDKAEVKWDSAVK